MKTAPMGFIIAIKEHSPASKRLRMVDLMGVSYWNKLNYYWGIRAASIRTDKIVIVNPFNFLTIREMLQKGRLYKESTGYKIKLKIYKLVSFADYCFFVADFLNKNQMEFRNFQKGIKVDISKNRDRRIVFYLTDTIDFLLHCGLRANN